MNPTDMGRQSNNGMTDPATTNEKQLYSEEITEFTGDALKDYCLKC